MKVKKIMILLLGLVLILTGCGNNAATQQKEPTEQTESTEQTEPKEQTESTEPKESSESTEPKEEAESTEPEENNGEKITVVTSMYPVYDLTKKVTGDKANVINLMEGSSDAHDWEPSAKDIKTINNADVMVFNGAGFEGWKDDVLAGVESKDLTVVDSSEGVNLIKLTEDEHDHEHEDADEHEHHHHGDTDPHIWLSLKNAMIQMGNIRDALVQVDPKNANEYQANFEAQLDKFKELEKQYEDALKPYKGKTIVVPHEAFGYLVRDFGLNQVGIEGINAEGDPNTKRMKEIVELCKKDGVNTVFYEEDGDSKTAEVLANEFGGKVAPISTLESLSKAQKDKGDDYLSIMKRNLQQIVDSFQ